MCLYDPKSYARGGFTPGGFFHARLVEGERTDREQTLNLQVVCVCVWKGGGVITLSCPKTT